MTTTEQKLVGPVIRGFDEDIINAVIDAGEEDNPGKEIFVDDRQGYVRVQADHEFRLTQASMVKALGRPFKMTEIEPSLTAFSGRLSTADDVWVWSIRN